MKYLVSFMVSATAVPLIALIHKDGGFGRLFAVLALCAVAVLAAVLLLPGKNPVVLGHRAPEPAE
jgi:hypothetical protein